MGAPPPSELELSEILFCHLSPPSRPEEHRSRSLHPPLSTLPYGRGSANAVSPTVAPNGDHTITHMHLPARGTWLGLDLPAALRLQVMRLAGLLRRRAAPLLPRKPTMPTMRMSPTSCHSLPAPPRRTTP